MRKYYYVCRSGVTVTAEAPELRVYKELMTASANEIRNIIAIVIGEQANDMDADEIMVFYCGYLDWIAGIKKSDANLNVPYYPQKCGKVLFANNSSDEKIVADYANCSIPEVERIDIFQFWGLLRDAVIWNCSRSKEGREYLENAYNFMQTEPDRNALRAQFGGEKNGNE